MRQETTWCTLCGGRFTADEVKGVTACPKCGNKGMPCDASEDLTVQINWHELRILGIWAENWARKSSDESMTNTVAAITRRLQRQHPALTPLTLSQELAELPAQMDKLGIKHGGVETNVPRPSPVPVNGPGAVRDPI